MEFIQGNKENELIEEMGFKLKNSDKKRLPKKNMLSKRKKTESLDVEEKPRLSKSVSFDSIASRFPDLDTQDDVKSGSFVDSSSMTRYHPVTNYLSPRPKYLMFSPDRHREILARKEMVDRIVKSASYDCAMNLSDEELESSVCSVEETSEIIDKSVNTVEENVEEMEEIIDKSIKTVEENVEETEEIIGESDKDDEFEDEKNGWSLKVLLKWLVVMIVLILTTLTISSVDSPTPSPVREAIRDCMDLYSKTHSGAGCEFSEVFKAISVRNYDYEKWDKKDLVVNGNELVEMQHEQIEDFWDYEVESEDEGSKEVEKDVDLDDIWGNMDSQQFQKSKTEEISYKFEEHVIPASKETKTCETEAENEINGQLLLIDSDEDVASEKDVVGKEDNNNDELNGNKIEGVKAVKFDPLFAAFIGISLLIFASSSVLYYSMQTEISSLVGTPKNEVSNVSSSITSFDQSTGDSQSHGSFTIEKIIVKKQVIFYMIFDI